MNGSMDKRFGRQARLMTGSAAVYDQITTDLSDMFAVPPHHQSERRTFIRLPYETEAVGRISDAGEGNVRIQDVSRIGLRLAAPCAIAPGAPVTLHFGDVHFEDAPVTLVGRAIWARPEGAWHQIGVAFDHAGAHTIGAASELFYAAMAGVSSRFEAAYARGVND